MPRLDFTSSLRTLNTNELEAEDHLLPEVDFNYYTSHEFHSSQLIRDSISHHCFSIIHLNIRSLAANFDHLTTLLSSLNHNFHIIGLSETKILKNKDPIINETIPGYSFFSQPTLHNAGGVGFYIREEIEFHFRDDLNAMTDDFECLWIEIRSKSRNTVCAIVYRHPNSNFENFKVYFTSAIDKISKE